MKVVRFFLEISLFGNKRMAGIASIPAILLLRFVNYVLFLVKSL